MNLFDANKPKFKLGDKPMRLIELFSGYGSQALALKYLNIPFEHYLACEIDKHAIQSYNDIHNTNFEPSDITKLESLNIVDTNKYNYILTYSYPCQDLSTAGKQKGMEEGSGTRSSLLWEVKRLLNECKELPQVLLMENVPQVLKAKGWNEWYNFLESKGYKNYCEILNAKDYGVAQKRKRCFMISILGSYKYEFPKPVALEKTINDYLESNVDKRYYLNERNKDYILDTKGVRGGIQRSIVNPNIAKTISCRGACDQRANITNFVILNSEREMRISECIQHKEDLIIRKLTPKECLRLMGVKDEDIDKMTVSKTQKYKQAGNSIVVDVLMAIFKELI